MINKAALIGSIASQAGKLFNGEKSRNREDFEHNLKAILHNALAKMDIVTRDEFDNQVAVLEHTRARLEALEKKLENQTSQPSSNETSAPAQSDE